MMQDLQILDELLKKGYDRRATPTNHLSKQTNKTKKARLVQNIYKFLPFRQLRTDQGGL